MIVDLKDKQWFLYSLFPLLCWAVLLTNFNFFYLTMAIIGVILTGYNLARYEWEEWSFDASKGKISDMDTHVRKISANPIFKILNPLLKPYGIVSLLYFNFYVIGNFNNLPYYIWMLFFLTWATILYGFFVMMLIPRYREIFDQGFILGQNMDNKSFWLGIGCKKIELKKYEEAIQSLDKAISIDPKFIDALGNRGCALDCLKRWEEAIQCYDKILEIDPTHSKTWYNRGITLAKIGKFSDALQSVDKALEFNPNYELALKTRDDLIDELKDTM
jgi:tetratricopeptide (TPR) repeat protein